MSDSHGNKNAILKAVAIEAPDLILHLGDNDRDISAVGEEFPEIPYRTVRGNCDHSSAGLDTDEFTLGDKRIFMTHGNLYGVKTGYSSIINSASCRGANLLLFGHTHVPYHSVLENITIVNPGSIGMGAKTYAVLELKDGGISCDILSLKLLK